MNKKKILILSPLTVFICIQSVFGLKCLFQTLDQESFNKTDLIVMGTVEKLSPSLLSKLGIGKNIIPFEIEVTKSWKGAKTGEKIKLYYQKSGGDGFPYQDGSTPIIFANKRNGRYTITGCSGYEIPIPEDLKDFIQNPPYIDKSKPIPDHILKLRKKRKNYREDVLDEFLKKYLEGDSK